MLRSLVLVGILAGVTSAGAAYRAWIPNNLSGDVSVIDTATDTVVATVPVGAGPSAVSARPGYGVAYVGRQGEIAVIDAVTNVVTRVLPVTGALVTVNAPVGLVGHPSGNRVYYANGDGKIFVVSGIGAGVTKTINAGNSDILLSPDGSRLYSAGNVVSFIDTTTDTVATAALLSGGSYLAIQPDGSRLYVARASGATGVSIVDTATAAVVENAFSMACPGGMAVRGDGARLYVADFCADRIAVFDTTTYANVDNFTLGTGFLYPFFHRFGLHPDGTRLYVSSYQSDVVSIVDPATDTPTGSIPVGDGPFPQGNFIGGCPPAGCDSDGDGFVDGSDNCPLIANPGQADGDGDGVGDVCDNCPAVANAPQTDNDHNGVGDACEDTDGDGVSDLLDNCRTVPNPSQTDSDGDGNGDACDICAGHPDVPDTDLDGIPDGCDNCPTVVNPSQSDSNGNGIGDHCEDRDGDGVVDAFDNCVDVPNPGQQDGDHDALGDACDVCTDSDFDGLGNPGYPNNTCPPDNCPFRVNPDQADVDGDGIGDVCQLCTALGNITNYVSIAAGTFTARALTAPKGGDVSIYGPVCSKNLTLTGSNITSGFGYATGNGVAIAKKGTAATLRDIDIWSPGAYDVFTGGGRVVQHTFFLTPTHTTGTDPEVADCQAAIGHMAAASTALAARPVTASLGDITLDPLESQDFVSFPDHAVVDVGSIVLKGLNPGLMPCGYGARLFIAAEIVNVHGKLSMGDCTNFRVFGGVVNVIGPGPAVTIGRDVSLEAPILAPGRKITSKGAHNYVDDPSVVAELWGKSVTMTDYTLLDPVVLHDGVCP